MRVIGLIVALATVAVASEFCLHFYKPAELVHLEYYGYVISPSVRLARACFDPEMNPALSTSITRAINNYSFETNPGLHKQIVTSIMANSSTSLDAYLHSIDFPSPPPPGPLLDTRTTTSPATWHSPSALLAGIAMTGATMLSFALV